jgi:hypothetical protein
LHYAGSPSSRCGGHCPHVRPTEIRQCLQAAHRVRPSSSLRPTTLADSLLRPHFAASRSRGRRCVLCLVEPRPRRPVRQPQGVSPLGVTNHRLDEILRPRTNVAPALEATLGWSGVNSAARVPRANPSVSS